MFGAVGAKAKGLHVSPATAAQARTKNRPLKSVSLQTGEFHLGALRGALFSANFLPMRIAANLGTYMEMWAALDAVLADIDRRGRGPDRQSGRTSCRASPAARERRIA